MEKGVDCRDLLQYKPGDAHAPRLFLLRLFDRALDDRFQPDRLARVVMGRLERPPVVVAHR